MNNDLEIMQYIKDKHSDYRDQADVHRLMQENTQVDRVPFSEQWTNLRRRLFFRFQAKKKSRQTARSPQNHEHPDRVKADRKQAAKVY